MKNSNVLKRKSDREFDEDQQIREYWARKKAKNMLTNDASNTDIRESPDYDICFTTNNDGDSKKKKKKSTKSSKSKSSSDSASEKQKKWKSKKKHKKDKSV